MKQVGMGYAHAKLILIGEHSVVHGQPAIAIPLTNIPVTAKIVPAEAKQTFISRAFSGSVSEMPGDLEGLRVLISRLLRRFKNSTLPFTLTVTSEIPEERGMGSSAAVATAIVRTIYDFFDVTLSDDVLLATVAVAETITHGTPSGIDAATVSAEQPVWFVKNQPAQHFSINAHGWVVVGDTGVTGQTSMAVNAVRALLEDAEQPEVGQQLVEHLGVLTHQAAENLKENQVIQLGNVLNQAHADLNALGVNHPVLQRLVDAANEAGALGAKLTGGGLGGCMFALTNDEQQAQKIAQALKTHGAVATWIEPLTHTA